MKHYIDADEWIEELELEKAEQNDWRRVAYIDSLIAKIKCRMKVNRVNENRCVSCGEIIPEGVQVCVNCLTKENEKLKNRCYMIADGDLCGHCSFACKHRQKEYKGVAKCE